MKCSNAYYIGKEIHLALSYGQEIRVIGVCEKSQLAHIGYIGDEPMPRSRSCHVKLSEISQDKPSHNLHWQQELSESLSKTPPAKEKLKCHFMYYIGSDPFIKYGDIVEVLAVPERCGGDHRFTAPVKTSDGVTVVVYRTDLSTEKPSREKSAADLLNEIRSGIDDRLKAAGGDKDAIKRLCSGSIFPAPDQNPTALILRQIADNLDSGLSAIVNSAYSTGTNEDGTRTSFTIEIVESAGGDRE